MTSDRVFTAILGLYPASFRDEYGDEVLAAFRQLWKSDRRAPVAFWAFLLRDVTRSVAGAWFDEWRQGPLRIVLRFVASSAIGTTVTIAAGQATIWTYRYFYHPYFEGVSIPLLPYGLCLGLVLGASVAVAQRVLLPARVRRASRWALASAVALPIAVLFCGAALDRALVGYNPLAVDVYAIAIGRMTTWTEIALQSSSMAASAFAVRFLLRRPLMERRHAH